MPTDTSLADLLRLPAGRELDRAVHQIVIDDVVPHDYVSSRVTVRAILPAYSTDIGVAWTLIGTVRDWPLNRRNQFLMGLSQSIEGRIGGRARSAVLSLVPADICRGFVFATLNESELGDGIAALRAKLAGGGA